MKSLSQKINESLNEDSKAYGEVRSFSEYKKGTYSPDYLLIDKKTNKIVAGFARMNVPKAGQKDHMDKNHQLISRDSAKNPAPYLDQTPIDYEDKKNWVNEGIKENVVESFIELDALDPNSNDLKALLKKNNVKMIIIKKETSSRPAEVKLTGSKKDLIKVLSDENGWDDEDLADDISESVVNESPSYPTKLEIVKTLYGVTDDKDFYQWSTKKSDTPWIVKPGSVFTLDSTQKISGKQYLDFINSKDGRETFEIDANQLETLIRQGLIKEVFGFNENLNETYKKSLADFFEDTIDKSKGYKDFINKAKKVGFSESQAKSVLDDFEQGGEDYVKSHNDKIFVSESLNEDSKLYSIVLNNPKSSDAKKVIATLDSNHVDGNAEYYKDFGVVVFKSKDSEKELKDTLKDLLSNSNYNLDTVTKEFFKKMNENSNTNNF